MQALRHPYEDAMEKPEQWSRRPVGGGWKWPRIGANWSVSGSVDSRGERRGQRSRQGNRGQAGIWQAELGDD